MRRWMTVAILAACLAAGAVAGAEQGKAVDDKTKTRVLSEIERYVAADVKLKKYFFLSDPRSGETLKLLPDHVHQGVSAGDRGYAACYDFKNEEGKVYDVDVFVSLDGEKARVEEIVLHKVDGKAVESPKSEGK